MINICLSFDQNYLLQFFVTITSVFQNNKNREITVHVIATGIDDTQKKIIEEYIRRNGANIFFYEPDNTLISKLVIPANTHFTSAIYYRLFFPLLLSGKIDKLLYLDTDTVVDKDLSELYNTDLGEYPVAAVTDSFMSLRTDLGFTTKEEYFNSGVLLINVDSWKKKRVTEKTITFIIENPEKILYGDQDGLNAILRHQWYRLDSKNNFLSVDLPANYRTRRNTRIIKKTVILHYCGPYKPWLIKVSPRYKYLYSYYLLRFFRSPYSRPFWTNNVETKLLYVITEALKEEEKSDGETLLTLACYLHGTWIKILGETLSKKQISDLCNSDYKFDNYKVDGESFKFLEKEGARLKESFLQIYEDVSDRNTRWLKRWARTCVMEISEKGAFVLSKMPVMINKTLKIEGRLKLILNYVLENFIIETIGILKTEDKTNHVQLLA